VAVCHDAFRVVSALCLLGFNLQRERFVIVFSARSASLIEEIASLGQGPAYEKIANVFLPRLC
jgi:hypothetical protein